MYNILEYTIPYLTEPIAHTIEVPKDYIILGVSNVYTTGGNFGVFLPNMYPSIQIAVNYGSLGTVNLNFFSIQASIGDIPDIGRFTYIGSYTITDLGMFTLWYEETPITLDNLDPSNLNLLVKANGGMNKDESGLVSQWEDHSNQSNNLFNEDSAKQYTYLADQINSLPVLAADSGDEYFQTYFTDDFNDLSSGISIFAVINPTPFNSSSYLLTFAASADVPDESFSVRVSTNFNNTSNVKFSVYQADVETYLEATALWDNQFQLLEITHNGVDTASMYVNGNLISTGAVGPFTTIERIYNFIGNEPALGSNGFYGSIAELLIYSLEVSEDTRKDIEAYINNKYALGSIKPQIDPPGINIEGSNSVTVTLLGPAGTPIYWTDNASDPKVSDNLYTEPFSISKNSFIKAKAFGLFGPSEVEKALIIIGSGGA